MEMSTGIGVTPGLKKLFDRLDEVLPADNKTKDFFAAFCQDLTDLIRAAESVGIDAEDLLGEALKIEVKLKPSDNAEKAYIVYKYLQSMEGKQ